MLPNFIPAELAAGVPMIAMLMGILGAMYGTFSFIGDLTEHKGFRASLLMGLKVGLVIALALPAVIAVVYTCIGVTYLVEHGWGGIVVAIIGIAAVVFYAMSGGLDDKPVRQHVDHSHH